MAGSGSGEPCGTPEVEHGACLESCILVRRIAPVHGVPPSSPSPAARAVLACTAVGPADNVRTSTDTASSTSGRCGHFRVKPAATAGRARGTNVAARRRHSARPTPCAPACVQRAADERRCAVCSRRRSPAAVSTSSPAILEPARPALLLPLPTLCATGSVRRTSWPGSLAVGRRRRAAPPAAPRPQAGFGRTLRDGSPWSIGCDEDVLAVVGHLGDALDDVVHRSVRSRLRGLLLLSAGYQRFTSSLIVLTSTLR